MPNKAFRALPLIILFVFSLWVGTALSNVLPHELISAHIRGWHHWHGHWHGGGEGEGEGEGEEGEGEGEGEDEDDPDCTNETVVEDSEDEEGGDYLLTAVGNFIEDGEYGKRWRIRNKTDEDTLVAWEIVGTELSGEFLVPAHSSLIFTSHFTDSASGGGTMKIYVDGELVDVKTHGGPDTDLSECEGEEGEGEGEAVERSGGGTSSPICAVQPVQLNLPDELSVSVRLGSPVVDVDWSGEESADVFRQVKVGIFMDYLETDPVIEGGGISLQSVFSRTIYDQLKNDDAFQSVFAENTTAESDVADPLFQRIGMETLFSDYWPYMAVELLKQDTQLGDVFLDALITSIQDEMSFFDGVEYIAKTLKDEAQDSQVSNSAACIADALSGNEIGDFVPGQGDAIYGGMESQMLSAYNQVYPGGTLETLLNAIRSSDDLRAGTLSSANSGVNTLMLTWREDPNVKQLIQYYETDEDFADLKEVFYQTEIAQKMESCIKTAYGRDLISIANEVRFHRAQQLVSEAELCDEDVTGLLMEVIQEGLTDPDLRERLEDLILDFLSDLLYIEETLSQNSDFDTSFTDFYNERLAELPGNVVDNMSLELYRDGTKIYEQENQSITHYFDSDLPPNDTGRIQYHDYYIITSTQCASEIGDSGRAQIDPLLEPGTPINTTADISLKVKDGYDVEFMGRLEELFSEDAEGESFTEDDCAEARNALLQSKTTKNAMDYVLACYSTPETYFGLISRQSEIVPPVLIFSSNEDELDGKTSSYLEPIIQSLEEILEAKDELKQDLGALPDMSATLLNHSSIDEFSEDEMSLIICGGYSTCDDSRKELVETYFQGVSHAATVNLEITDEEDSLINSLSFTTDLFGRAEDVALGEILSGQVYQVRINLDESPYTLAKVFNLIVNNAEPQGDGSYAVTLDLVFSRGFRYGNFDNSDEVINGKDIVAWFDLLEENPELWLSGNLDGRSGIDLLDVVTFQQSWGIEGDNVDDFKFTLGDLFRLFGLTPPENASQVLFETTSAQDPHWLNLLESECSL